MDVRDMPETFTASGMLSAIGFCIFYYFRKVTSGIARTLWIGSANYLPMAAKEKKGF
jgi:hypothetical protein